MRWDGLLLHDEQARQAAAPAPAVRARAAAKPMPVPAGGTVTGPEARHAGQVLAGTAPDRFFTQAAMFDRAAVARTFDTPGFRGVTFYEVHARSIINKVPGKSRMPFRWTINPYRGCGHACVYCFARGTHAYLDLDTGPDFDSAIIVKVNAADLAGKELARPGWAGEHIAMGTNVDCYQRAEGRYRLMPGIIAALREAANPFSIVTKGTLLLRDLDLIQDAAQVTSVGLSISVGFTDADLSASVEPGTPSPQRRLDMCAAIASRGLRCGVLMGPVLPYLSDSPGQLGQTVRQIALSGAASVTPVVLHLRPGAREWYLAWLRRTHPELAAAYQWLYGAGSYARKDYQRRICATVADLAARYGIGRAAPAAARRIRQGSRSRQATEPGPVPPQATRRVPGIPARTTGTQLTLL